MMIPYAVSIEYMIAGYMIIFVILALFLVSLAVRWKNLKSDLQELNALQKRQ